MFEAVLSWVKADVEARRDRLADLLVKVRLPLMTPQYLADRVGSDDLVKTSLRCRSVAASQINAFNKDYNLII